MPGNAFIQFRKEDGGQAPGESQQIGHLGNGGWIEIGDWSWDVEAEASHLKGTGAAVGKPSAGVLSFSHYYDKSSPVLMQFIVKGTHFKSARIDMLKQTGKDQPELYLQFGIQERVHHQGGQQGRRGRRRDTGRRVRVQGGRAWRTSGRTTRAFSKRPSSSDWNIAEMTDSTDGGLLTLK